jgi:D-glycero-beta-D-manno-heptose-7-phosphate kinase
MKRIQFSELKVLVVGDIMLDNYIYGTVERISPEAPVPILRSTDRMASLGGAANVAINISKLGANTELFGVIGQDRDGDSVMRMLSDNGINFQRCPIDQSVKTISKTRVIAQRQQMLRIDLEDFPTKYACVSDQLIAGVVDRIHMYDAVIVSDYAKGVITQDVLNKLKAATEKNGVFISIDPKPKRPLKIMGFNLMNPNLKEAVELINHNCETLKLYEILNQIKEDFKPKHLVVTLGEDGMATILDDGSVFKIPSFAKEVVDVSGAGDTVISALTLALAAGFSCSEAMNIANQAAGIVVGKQGTSYVTYDEIKNYCLI